MLPSQSVSGVNSALQWCTSKHSAQNVSLVDLCLNDCVLCSGEVGGHKQGGGGGVWANDD